MFALIVLGQEYNAQVTRAVEVLPLNSIQAYIAISLDRVGSRLVAAQAGTELRESTSADLVAFALGSDAHVIRA